jgi:hypothetical protein
MPPCPLRSLREDGDLTRVDQSQSNGACQAGVLRQSRCRRMDEDDGSGMSASIDDLTLREKLRNVEKLTRELSDHLERGFIPKVHALRTLSRRGSESEHRDTISDIAVREGVSTVLKSDRYARELCDKAKRYLRSIQSDIDGMFA